ncbi:S8 family serine peptidase [Neobacillus drentensis]|uniref:S8 family serine peptidase n=1 Tax=Neobacillus drentensis TaxID=220684 RepID=UPI002FFEEB01
METRIVIIPKNSAIARDNKTKVLHEYQNGDLLVKTEAITGESEATLETRIVQGIRLEAEREKHLTHARNTFYGMNKQENILAYVEFIGPIDPRWIKMIKNLGVNPLRYQPDHTYLCQGTVVSFMKVEKQSFVLHVTPLIDLLKPKNEKLGESKENVWIIAQATRDEAQLVMEELEKLTNVEIDHDKNYEGIDYYLRIPAVIDLAGQDQLLKHPRVIAVENRQEAKLEDEVAGLIIAGGYDANNKPNGSYLQFLSDNGISGEGVTIGIVDDGVDVSHEAFNNRIKDLTLGNKAWHATFVAGHAAGYYVEEVDRDNFIYGLGIAPHANILSQDKQKASTDLCKETVTETGPNSAAGLVQNNSWGAGINNPMDYLSSEAAYDSFVRNSDPDSPEPKPLTICFSSGNNGSQGLTRPKAAKNIIVTGNSENYRPEDSGRSDSDNINEVFTGHNPSSHGNCGDGRIRPHVVSPGEWTASAGFDIHEGEQEYISPKLTWGGGSSGASPKTAGACALLIQWWRNLTNGQNPSPAMLRSLIVNSAEPMNFREFIPNKYEGWGRLNLKNALSQDVNHTYVDQSIFLTNPGEQKEWIICPTDSNKPIKITLAWTDPPGPIGSGKTVDSSAIVNKLALRVEVNGKVYRGNNFINGWSTDEEVAGAQKEGTDNLQNVYLKEGVAQGNIRVIVKAIEISTNCMNGQIDIPQQDFALVITNGHIDQGYTPTDVFLLIDEAANEGQNSQDPANYWDEHPNSKDDNVLGPAPAEYSDSEKVDLNEIEDYNANADEEESWWDNTEVIKSEAERSPQKTKLIENQQFMESLRAGIEIGMVRNGNRIHIPSDNGITIASNTPLNTITTESKREHISLDTVKKSSVKLSNALVNLMKNWDDFGVSNNQEPIIRSRSGVLVIGSGTRVSRQDLDMMRKLAFKGNLYLVSDQPLILSFLAQRIHRHLGVQFRLASYNDLGSVIQQTLAEASGAQQIEVETVFRSSDGEFHSHNTFSLVEADRDVVIRINYRTGERLPQVKLKRLGTAPIMLSPLTKHEEFETLERDGVLEVIFQAKDNNQNWTGEWELQITLSKPFEYDEPVSVWAWSTMNHNIQGKESRKSETSRGKEETLVTIVGNTNTTFRHCQIEPRIISNQEINTGEARRMLSATVSPSRLDYEANLESNRTGTPRSESAKTVPPSASSIGVWVPHNADSESAVVVDLTVKVEGVDTKGNIFKRILRDNLIKLVPRSKWRKQIKQEKTIVLHDAWVSKVNYDSSGIVKSITLQKGNRTRDVYLSFPITAEQLGYMDLMDKNLLFRVQGNNLLGVIRKF